MVMLDEFIQRHAYNNNSNTSQLNSTQDKTSQGKARQEKRRWNIHILVAYYDNDNDNDKDNDNHYSMNSDGMKIIS